ncbi:hypothetical protein EDC04DRAFT_2614212 [Pisolithus marmoratus]|nr:hypothetical protein EDC04DRAFT_2614212 [Pisolithus marmoratus]
MPYFVFTRMVEGKSVPACDKPTFICGVCKRASKAKVCTGPILILHFIYMGMNSRGSLPRVLNSMLEEYHTASTLRYHEVVFDFGTWDKLCLWETKAQALATEIGNDNFEHKVIFVLVHSEVTCGDLFVGKDEKGEDVAVEPLEKIYYFHVVMWSPHHVPRIYKQLEEGNNSFSPFVVMIEKCKYEFFSYPPVGPYEVIKENKSMGWIKQTGI